MLQFSLDSLIPPSNVRLVQRIPNWEERVEQTINYFEGYFSDVSQEEEVKQKLQRFQMATTFLRKVIGGEGDDAYD